MTLLALALQAFFTDRLITQRNSTFRLLLTFAQRQTGKQPFRSRAHCRPCSCYASTAAGAGKGCAFTTSS